MPLIWLSGEIQRKCVADANLHYPRESGGVFMGYVVGSTFVVTAMIGGGDTAIRTRASYEPDVEWQNRQIALHYERSGRLDMYLGDWHSHPNTKVGYLSGDDRAVLRRLINSTEAGNPSPLMMIFAGTRSSWKPFAWQAELRPRTLWFSKLVITAAIVRIYD